jgi:transcription elongation GreA/GreB family factor
VSVAFRRESDEEHLEPKFELPIPPGPNLVTERGYALIKARTEELESLAAAEQDEERRKILQRDLRYWRTRLATARLAMAPGSDAVAFGTRVTFDQAGETRILAIVGHDEADPTAGLIAFTAPLARALMGAEPGEEVESPGDGDPITIRAVEPLDPARDGGD